MVSVTDFALAALSAVLAWRLVSHATEMRRTRYWLTIVFSAIAISSLLGAVSHGFVPEEQGRLGEMIWRATLVAIGPAGVGLFLLGAILLFRPAGVERARVLGLIALAIYTGVVLFEYQDFWIALLIYLPPTLLLLLGFALNLRRNGGAFALDGCIAMVLTLTAGLLQYLRVGLHPVYFNHNAVYHLAQGIALVFLYRAGSKWLEPHGSELPNLKSQPIVARIG